MKKNILLIIILSIFVSCSVEKKAKEHRTEYVFYDMDSTKYPVYRTRYGKWYILEQNKRKTRFKRVYLYHGFVKE